MKIKIQIDTGFVSEGGSGAKWKMVNLSPLHRVVMDSQH